MSSPLPCAGSWISEGGIELFVHRRSNSGRMPVLLLHGASAKHETFTFPPSEADLPRNLVDWLFDAGFDVWLLDWRGSARVVDVARESGALSSGRWSFDLDHAARSDLPEAIEWIRSATGRQPGDALGIVGHCMGAAVVAQAIAQGSVDPEKTPLRVALLSIGLFYDVPADSRLRSQDHVLERLLAGEAPPLEIDPRRGETWPTELRDLYSNLVPAGAHRPAPGRALSAAGELCNRLGFLYGRPYLEANLFPTLHDEGFEIDFERGRLRPSRGDLVRGRSSRARAVVRELLTSRGSWASGDCCGKLLVEPLDGAFRAGEELEIDGARSGVCARSAPVEPELLAQFGAIPLRLYAHAWRNLRRGWAAPFDADEEDASLVGVAARRRFHSLARLLLLTGERNALWHRSGIDRMAGFLSRGDTAVPTRITRRILRGYGHQDLLWGRRAYLDVFPEIGRALTP